MAKRMDDIRSPGVKNKDQRGPSLLGEKSLPLTAKSDDTDNTKEGRGAPIFGVRKMYRGRKMREQGQEDRRESPFFTKLRDKHSVIRRHIEEGGGFSRRPKQKIWAYVLGALIVFFFFLYAFFPSVTIEVTPRVEQVALAGEAFTATSNATEGLAFRTLTTTETLSDMVVASDVKEAQEKASGQLTIYNTYSEESLELVENTRFLSPEGKIYRIQEAVIVPGMKGSDPGEVTAEVSADQAGEDYNFKNIGARFTIPGLKDAPEFYQGFYAKLETPITGGFSGISKVVSDEQIQKVKENLSQTLKEALLRKARENIPAEYILFDGATSYSFDVVAQNRSNLEEKTVKVLVTGALDGIVFDRSALAKAIAKKGVRGYQGDQVQVLDWSEVTMAMDDESSESDGAEKDETPGAERLEELKKVNFTLTGNPVLRWIVPKEKVLEALTGEGTEMADFKKIFALFEDQIIVARIVGIRPFWMGTFPEDPTKIELQVKKLEVETTEKESGS